MSFLLFLIFILGSGLATHWYARKFPKRGFGVPITIGLLGGMIYYTVVALALHLSMSFGLFIYLTVLAQFGGSLSGHGAFTGRRLLWWVVALTIAILLESKGLLDKYPPGWELFHG